MRILQLLAYGVFATSCANAASLPESGALSILEAHGGSSPRSSDILTPDNALEKRKGGGGKGGGGGGGGGKSTGGGGAGARTGPGSNAGGATRAGSGPSRAYGGGGYYGGGASTPYPAGKASTRNLSPGLLILPAAALIIFPGLWLYSVYPYSLNRYHFYNETARNESRNDLSKRGLNESLPVTCLCQEFQVCGCDNNDNPQYLNELVGNGSYDALNKTLVTVSDVDGTRTLVINGSLPNGTTAPGGTDDAAAGLHLGHNSVYWLMGLVFVYSVAFL